MYEVLALSAFNLSIKHPAKSDLYLNESTILQTKALSLFNAARCTRPAATEDNLIASFLFSAGLGMHFFCNTFCTPSSDLNAFLDRLVQSIRLLRGVRAMIGNSWAALKNSNIRFLLQDEAEPVENRNDEITSALESLRTKFSQSRTLSAFESNVYCEAITGLLWVYNSHPPESAPYSPTSSRMIVSWPISISAEYTELPNERKPEALVVMAYFSILLHQRRSFWAVGDAGRFLFTAIEEYLGEGWAEWLIVPKGMVLAL